DGAIILTATAGNSGSEQIESLAIGIAGALTGGQEGGVSLSGAGSSSNNSVYKSVEATIKHASRVTTGHSGTVQATAQDQSKINAAAGSGALSLAGGQGGGVSVAVGASISTNTISNTVTAAVEGSTVLSDGGVQVTAKSAAVIYAVASAGVIAGAGGQEGGLAVSGAGAGTYNTVTNTV